MSKLTDKEIIKALKIGKTIRLESKIKIRELLNEGRGFLYVKGEEKDFWKPFHPDLADFESELWRIE